MMKKNHYEKFVDLVEYTIFRNSDITSDVRPSTCSVLAHVALGQKSLQTPGSEDPAACKLNAIPD